MITRHKIFLREIIANYFGMSEKELCELGNVTEKTLKSDLQAIQSSLNEYGLSLCMESNRIYIPFEEKNAFIDAYEDIISKDEKQLLASEAMERKMFILTFLTRSEGYISMNILADKLYVSKSSISPLVHELEDEIPKLVPSVKMDISGRKGVRICASEKEMRELLVRAFIQKEGLAIENIYFLNYLEDDLKDKLSQLIDVIDDFLNNHHVFMANNNVSKIIMHTMVIVQRTRHKSYLDEKDVNNDLIFEEYSKALKEIGLEVPSRELSCLPLQTYNRYNIENPLSSKIIKEFVEIVNKEYKTEIIKEDEVEPLTAHLDELLKKGIRSSDMKEFVFDQMLQRLLSAYLLCGTLCDLIYKYTGIVLDEENRAYMAMHIQSLYRKHLVIKENILLYDSNIPQCDMIKIDLEKHFGSKADISPVYVRWDIEKKLSEKNYAIILSTKSVLGSFDNVPFLKINPFVTNVDYDAINMIVYKNRPVVVKQATYDDDCMCFNGIRVKLDREIVYINGYYLMSSINDILDTAVYEFTYSNRHFFVLNYNLNDSFIVYHRLINRFGQMMKNKQI